MLFVFMLMFSLTEIKLQRKKIPETFQVSTFSATLSYSSKGCDPHCTSFRVAQVITRILMFWVNSVLKSLLRPNVELFMRRTELSELSS